MRVELSGLIEGDLDAIADYIAQDNPTRAVSFIREIRAQFRAVGQNPLLTSYAPNWAKMHVWRSWAGMSSCFVSWSRP